MDHPELAQQEADVLVLEASKGDSSLVQTVNIPLTNSWYCTNCQCWVYGVTHACFPRYRILDYTDWQAWQAPGKINKTTRCYKCGEILECVYKDTGDGGLTTVVMPHSCQ